MIANEIRIMLQIPTISLNLRNLVLFQFVDASVVKNDNRIGRINFHVQVVK